MNGNSFNVAHIEYDCSIYGPGMRTVIWFQGCSIRCEGCWNKEMWSNEPIMEIDREELLLLIEKTGNKGITFLGGEPLDQCSNLLWFVRKLKEKSFNIMLYSGYEPEEIEMDDDKKSVCDLSDILVLGRYHQSERDINLLWRGSRNQKIITKVPIEIEERNEVEIQIDEDGQVVCMGYPSPELLKDLFNK